MFVLEDDDQMSRKRKAPPKAISKNKKQKENEETDLALFKAGLTAGDVDSMSRDEKSNFMKMLAESVGGGSASSSQTELMDSQSLSSDMFDFQPIGNVNEEAGQPCNNDEDDLSSGEEFVNEKVSNQEDEYQPPARAVSSMGILANQRTRTQPNRRAQISARALIASNQESSDSSEPDDVTPLIVAVVDAANQPSRNPSPAPSYRKPYFTFECDPNDDRARSPSPLKLSSNSRNNKPTFDPRPLYTPEGYCPIEYSKVILQQFNDCLQLLYKHQCATLPRRPIGEAEAVVVGRCFTGTMDAFHRKRRDQTEREENYQDWRDAGGVPRWTEAAPGQPASTFRCDKHGFHSIPIPANDSQQTEHSDEYQDFVVEEDSPVIGDSRKRKACSGSLPDQDTWDSSPKKMAAETAVNDDDYDVRSPITQSSLISENSMKEVSAVNSYSNSNRDADDPSTSAPKRTADDSYRNKLTAFASVLSQGVSSFSQNMARRVASAKQSFHVSDEEGSGSEKGDRQPKRSTRKLASKKTIILEPVAEAITIDDDEDDCDVRCEDSFDEIIKNQLAVTKKRPNAKITSGNSKQEMTYTSRDVERMSEICAGYLPTGATGVAVNRPALNDVTMRPQRDNARAQTTAAQTDQVDCPLCGDKYDENQIEQHASDCDGTRRANLVLRPKTVQTRLSEAISRSQTGSPVKMDGIQLIPASYTQGTSQTRTLRRKVVVRELCPSCGEFQPQALLEEHTIKCLASRRAEFGGVNTASKGEDL